MSAKHCPRAWEPFKKIPMRLSATNKMVEEDKTGKAYGRRQARTRANALDIVRGCPGAKTNNGRGCPWGCYAVECMRRYHKLFHIPVSMELREDVLHQDLEDCPDGWIRIGVNGDPGEDFPLLIKVCKMVQEHKKTAVVVTRLWTLPSMQQLADLSRTGAIMHVSMCALDSDKMITTRLDVLNAYKDLGGKAVMRLVTFKFTDPALMVKQEALYKWGGAVLEQPARLQKPNPSFELVVKAQYKPYHDYVTGKPTNRWLTAGELFSGPHCGAGCPKCENKCMAAEFGVVPKTAPVELAEDVVPNARSIRVEA
jgi:hypothetical protein